MLKILKEPPERLNWSLPEGEIRQTILFKRLKAAEDFVF
jgi:hypothetical protein